MRSSNGTYVNGRRINGTVRLQHGDELQVGSLCFEVEVPDGAVPISGYRIDHRKSAWLFAEGEGAEQEGIQSGDTALLKALSGDTLDGDTDVSRTQGPADPSSSVTLTAGSLLKSMIPKKVNGDRANGTS
jgi:predicted component of type VI protein secretion system